MATVTQEYVDSLPEIYRDILSAFPVLEPSRRYGYGLAIQTIFAQLEKKYSLGEIIEACQSMAEGGALRIRERMFVQPTDVGEEIIQALTGTQPARHVVPPFSPPPAR